MQSNMLAEDKIKLHGMRSNKWTIWHRLVQYKGIVGLYERDQVHLKRDASREEQTLKKDITKIRRHIRNAQQHLSSLRKGDRQTIQNSLSAHKHFLLAYQYYPAQEIVQELYDRCFCLRREEDAIYYDLRRKTQKLIDMNLSYAKLQDTIMFEKEVPFPDDERETRILASQVEEFVLKRDAANIINETYRNMLDILEKDAIYYDAVLAALQIDGYTQSKCILHVVEMGQLATEYVDDKRKEIDFLETAIKHNRAEGNELIDRMEKMVDDLQKDMRNVTQREDSLEFDEIGLSNFRTPSIVSIIKDIEKIKDTLDQLRRICYATTVVDILPRLQEQDKQMVRLGEMLQSTTKKRDDLKTKLTHAGIIQNELASTMAETTEWYNSEKSRLMGEIDETLKAQEELQTEIIHLGELKLILRAALHHLAQLLRNVDSTASQMVLVRTSRTKIEDLLPISTTRKYRPSRELMDIIIKKLNELVAMVDPASLNMTTKRVAANVFQSFVCGMLEPTLLSRLPPPITSLIDEIALEDPNVPNRLQMKAESDAICKQNAKSEFDVPVLTVKKS